MKCNYCNQIIPEELVEAKRTKMSKDQRCKKIGDWNMYCNQDCFKAARAVPKTDCVQCGEITKAREGIWSGRELCKECYKGKVMDRYTNDEIIYLVTHNPGVGLTYFVRETNPTFTSFIEPRERLRLFLEEIGSYESVDYVGWLENPKLMVRVLQDDVPPELEWSIIGERRSIVSNQVKRARIRDGLPVNVRNNYYVRIPPLFKWGKLQDLRDKIYGE